MALALEIPIRLTRELLHQLTEANLLIPVQSRDDRERRYQPARDVENMTVQFVIRELEKTGTEDIPVAESPELKKLRDSLQTFEAALEDLPDNLALKNLSPASSKIYV